MAGLFENILINLKEKKQEGKIQGGYHYKDGKLNIGGGYYGDDSMFEVDVNKDGGNILFKKRFADGGSTTRKGFKGGGSDASTTSYSQSFDRQHGTNTASRANKTVDRRQAAGQRQADNDNSRIEANRQTAKTQLQYPKERNIIQKTYDRYNNLNPIFKAGANILLGGAPKIYQKAFYAGNEINRAIDQANNPYYEEEDVTFGVPRYKDGGSTNGSGDAALSAKVKELMDDGYEFGEAVKEAMRQGYKKGGLAKPELQKLDSVFNEVNKRGLRPQIKRLYDLGYGAGEIAKRLSTGANKVLFEGSTGKSRMQRYLQKAKQTYNWSEPEFKLRNQQGINLKDPKTIEKFQKIANKPKYKNFNKRDLVRAGVLSKKAAEKITPQRTERVSKPENKNATKDRRKARIKKFSSDVAEKKSAAPLGSKKESSHLGNRKSKVTTSNKAMLSKDVNKLSYHPFEKKIDNIQYRQRAIELNRSMSVEAKRKALAKLAAEDRALRLKYPEYRNIKSRLSFTESPMSKTGFKYKDVIRDPKITLSGGKTGANVVFKNASKADLAKIKDLATKGNSLYSFPANIAKTPGMTKGAVKSIAKSVGKVLGVAALPLEAYFMKQMYDEGKTMAEILSSPLMLNSVVGDAQDLLKMNSLERQAVTDERISQDETLLDTDFSQPYRQGLQSVNTEMVKDRVAQERALEEEKRKNLRNKTLPNQGLLRILSNPTYEGVL